MKAMQAADDALKWLQVPVSGIGLNIKLFIT
jgi:hypothetical protein